MRPARSARVAATARMVSALTAAGLLLGGCAIGRSGNGGPPLSADGTPATGGPARAAAPLEPLPAAIPAGLASYYGQRLDWRSCDQSFECAGFKVPLDYDHPGHGDLTLGAVRAKASGAGAARHLGSLVLNPGGPGGSAVTYLEAVAGSYSRAVRAAYDLVGVDPRGVGRSSPVSCLSGERMDAFTAVDTTPGTTRQVDELVAADKEFAAGCAKRSGAVLGHLSTVEAARDLDVLRALLGDPKLSYVGKSYGTMLGATYAGLFPSRAGRLVLDGAMDPSLDALAANRAQAGGFETAWEAFAGDCTAHPDCPIGHNPEEAGEELNLLLANLEATPLGTDQGRKLTAAQATTGVIQAMYAESLWPQLRSALETAKAGDGSGLLKLSDSYYERSADGTYPSLMFANMAINCLDMPAPFTGPDQVARVLPDFEKASPHFGRVLAWMALACAYWPVPATGRPHTIRAEGAEPIVVVGTTRDPATPYSWAKSLAGQLASGRLLTFDGDGHTAYGRHNDCVDSAVDRYLLEGEQPESGLSCGR
ncbi:alpha/beta hydrolase [Kitasatospora sp. NPDC052896]|uniref:alpha/beta hydrolase n=1 Tax=Kitasatospora sp. NPDC052896 TaxID=3364061 RepID=UPI0037C9D3DF